jgi:hypothetical protein
MMAFSRKRVGPLGALLSYPHKAHNQGSKMNAVPFVENYAV